MAEKDTNTIDIGLLFSKVWSKRKLFYFKVWPITFVVSCLLIICVPRYYVSESKLAPEMGNALGGMGGIGSIASSFGIDLNNVQTTDAITPMLYPDLIEDNKFVHSLFSVHVKSADGEIDTDYYSYLKNHQKRAWWSVVMGFVSKGIKSLLPAKKVIGPQEGTTEKNPYWLSEDEERIANAVRGNVNFNVNKQNAVITISVKAQDPLIAKTMVDSVQLILQQFITDYRTNKARIDEEHFRQLVVEAEKDYEKTCNDYAYYADANSNIVISKYQVRKDNLGREINSKYSTLQTLKSQLQLASAKVQERTPAFTIIKGASVGSKPAGPKRMLFVIAMLILMTSFCSFWIVKTDLKTMLLPK